MILDGHTKQEILRNEPFTSAFRPNRAVLMTVVHLEPTGVRRCPSCLRESLEKEDELISWYVYT
jgi:hypothetical protein